MALYCHFQTLSKTKNLYIQRSFQHNDSFLIIDSCNELISNTNETTFETWSSDTRKAKSSFPCANIKGLCLIFSCCLLNSSYFCLSLRSWNRQHRSSQRSGNRWRLDWLGFSPIGNRISRQRLRLKTIQGTKKTKPLMKPLTTWLTIYHVRLLRSKMSVLSGYTNNSNTASQQALLALGCHGPRISFSGILKISHSIFF